jgi:Ca-activated chloride channel family protein
MRKHFILFIVLLFPVIVEAQNYGELKGTVTEDDGKTPIPFANIILEQNGVMITGQSADVDGHFWIKNIMPGTYDVKFAYVGLHTLVYNNIVITDGNITTLYPKMEAGTTLKEFTVTTSKIKLDPGNTSQGGVFNRKEIVQNPTITTLGLVNSTPGVYTRDGFGNFSGARQGATVFVDGAKVRNVPAKYGDVVPDEILPIDNESYSTLEENNFTNPVNTPLSTFSVDVDKASYSNTRRMIKDGMLPPADAIRIEEMINYFSYEYPQPATSHPFSINLESAICPWNTQHQLVLVGLQGKKYAAEELPPANLVFLIDVSGSMADQNKLPLVKSSLRALVKQLRKEDKVSIVVYAGRAGLVLPATTGDHKGDILSAIDQLSAGGSTAGGEGIQLAYKIAKENLAKDGNNRVILCTDGDFNVGVSSETELENLITSKRDEGIYLTVLGYGVGNYKDSKMEILADKGNGNYAYIDSQLEADKVLVQEMSGTLYTIAKDVKIQIEFNPATVKSYRLLGYENRLLKDWEFNDDTRDAGEIGAGHSVTALYEVEYYTTPNTVLQDSLKYQTRLTNPGFNDEVLTVKFRYKRPMETASNLITQTFNKTEVKFDDASENLRFAATVAGFGMILRNSPNKGNATLDLILAQAKDCRKYDADGYRAEFMNLVKATQSLMLSK